MRAIGYFRESPERGETFAQQNRAFMEYCEREGLEVDRTFVEEPNSNGHASVFRQLLELLRRGEDGYVVVVPRLEALGTTLADAARRYFQIEGLGVKVTQISGEPDLTGELVAQWTAQETGSNVGDRVRAAMRRKAVKGEVLGRPPYGYKVGSRRRLELVPEEAVVVRYIYRLYLQEDLGIRLIARRLNEEALKTRRGGNWSMVSIRDILRNRVYLGTYSRFGVRVAGSHPSLVSPEDFHKVEDRLNSRRTSYKPRQASKFLLSGIASCGYCGNRLIGVSRRQSWTRRSGERVENSYRYYQCESRTNQSVCNYHTRRADALEEDVRRELAVAVASTKGRDVGPDRAAGPPARQLEKFEAKLRAIDRRIARYVDAAAKGRLSKDKMRNLSVGAAADRLAIEDTLAAAASRGADPSGSGAGQDDVLRLLSTWPTASFDRKQAALRQAVGRIVVTDDAVKLELNA